MTYTRREASQTQGGFPKTWDILNAEGLVVMQDLTNQQALDALNILNRQQKQIGELMKQVSHLEFYDPFRGYR